MGRYRAYPKYRSTDIEWIDSIPAHWITSFLGFECSVKARLGWKGLKAEEYVDEGYVFLATPNIKNKEIDFLNVDRITKERYEESPEIKLEEGDVLVTKDGSTTGTTNLVRLLPEPATVNSSIAVLRSKGKVKSCFLFYFFTSDYIQNVIERMRGGMGVPHLFQADLRKFKLLVPPDIEQQKIANFLDHETAKIDTLIEKQQQLIKLLKEKRQAVISHAVTKGLNPNAPMRDSGVEWLGEVPKHWAVKKFKFLCNRIIAGPFGSSIKKDMYVKSGYKVYGQEQVIPNDFEIGDYHISEKHYLDLYRYKVGEGDILISCVGTFGKIAVFPKKAAKGIINPRLIKAELCCDNDPYYIRELLKSEMVFKQFELLSRGGTMGVINIAILSEILTSVPPKSEQNEIVKYINQQKENFSRLSFQANKAVLLLQERRTALISAAVTGKIDLRNWQAPKVSN